MRKGILKAFPKADLEMLVVWIKMMKDDTYEAAQKALRKFKDSRVTQFFDPHQLCGRVFAESLGHAAEIAWDIYLFYPAGAVWHEMPPPPGMYMHQLRDSWADQSRLFEGKVLRKKITKTMKLMLS